MLNVTIEIKAPEIVEALKALAGSLSLGAKIDSAGSALNVLPNQNPGASNPQAFQAPAPPNQYFAPSPGPGAAPGAIPGAVPSVPPQNGVPAQMQAPAAAVPTTAPAYTMDQLAVAATQLMDAGRQAEVLNLLASFGVQALTMLPKEQYGNFATQLRAMGAKI